MVTTGEGRFYSTGVDVTTVQSPNPNHFLEVLTQLQQLLARLLTFPVVTVAAINGKEEEGGALLLLFFKCNRYRSKNTW